MAALKSSCQKLLCCSPRERLELSEVGPAWLLCLCPAPCWAVPACLGLRRWSPTRVPEVCCPAWTWRQDKERTERKTKQSLERCSRPYMRRGRASQVAVVLWLWTYSCLTCSAQSPHPRQTQSRGPALCLRSPCCSWSFPLRSGTLQTWTREEQTNRGQSSLRLTDTEPVEADAGDMSPSLPCSGFSLCCIVDLLLLPDVLLLLSIIKLAYPLFTAGFESSRIGLCTNQTHTSLDF